MKKYNVIPGILLIYLIVMAYMGLDSLRNGDMTIGMYLFLIIITLGCIILLRRNMIRRYNQRNKGK